MVYNIVTFDTAVWYTAHHYLRHTSTPLASVECSHVVAIPTCNVASASNASDVPSLCKQTNRFIS